MDKYKISWKNVVINHTKEMSNEIDLNVFCSGYAPCFLIIPLGLTVESLSCFTDLLPC